MQNESLTREPDELARALVSAAFDCGEHPTDPDRRDVLVVLLTEAAEPATAARVIHALSSLAVTMTIEHAGDSLSDDASADEVINLAHAWLAASFRRRVALDLGPPA